MNLFDSALTILQFGLWPSCTAGLCRAQSWNKHQILWRWFKKNKRKSEQILRISKSVFCDATSCCCWSTASSNQRLCSSWTTTQCPHTLCLKPATLTSGWSRASSSGRSLVSEQSKVPTRPDIWREADGKTHTWSWCRSISTSDGFQVWPWK